MKYENETWNDLMDDLIDEYEKMENIK